MYFVLFPAALGVFTKRNFVEYQVEFTHSAERLVKTPSAAQRIRENLPHPQNPRSH